MKTDNNSFLEARNVISDIDAQMAKLFEQRMQAVKCVADYKAKNGVPVEDAERENALIKASSSLIQNDEIKSYYVNYLKNTMSLSKDYQHKLIEGTKVAFSGVKGAFAEIAVKRIFPDCSAVPYSDFKSAYKAVENGECDCAVLPLENSYQGDVAQVMDLSFFGSLYINGVYDMLIEQHLFGVHGSNAGEIKTVISHPQALGQCADYIAEHGFSVKESVNTALAAKEVADKNDTTLAVICSLEAGAEYGLTLLDRKINRDSSNTTRFAVFSRVKRDYVADDGNFIVLFTVKDEAGSLGKAVSVFGNSGYNLKALKSRPSKDVIWNYYFFLEGVGKLTDEAEEAMLASLGKVCTNVRLLGKYGREKSI